ncbi:uncharacterized protein DUF4232 [Streptomyces sp. 2132.2]|uniref:DUF4232 domain-containing protein n=1 Tax=Streptomyces TaxID=1883 RepID=UPI000F467989|nr:DUF4232 domain-containing protein [Streptomyces sp. 2132.2]ROQ98002.1 uncharacterized protein DUF4232 [Streptomyces sp. 2132.2]
MTRWVAGVVVGVVVAGAAMGCDVPPAPDAAPGPSGIRPPAPTVAASPPAPKAPACPAGGVRLAEGTGDAAMGLRVADIQLVNCGTEPYVLEGYPEIRLLDGKRAPVEVTVQHGGDGIAAAPTGTEGDPQRVELRPGQAAGFGMVWRNLVTDSTVPAAEGWVLEVTPRAGAPRVELELRHSVDLGNTGKLGISPWKAAAR